MLKRKKRNFLKPGNLLVLLLVGYAFYYLNIYRYNNPLPVTTKVINFKFKTINGKEFDLNSIKINKAIVFFNHKGVYSPYYFKILPDLIRLNNGGNVNVLVLLNVKDIKDIKKLLQKRKYKILENIIVLTNIDKLASYFGVRSWPHFFLLNRNNEIIYEAKLPSIREVESYIRSY
jgi:hypothetical protein